MPRLFFALLPAPAERAAMHATAQSLVRRTGGRTVAMDDLHLTLCFLGEVSSEKARQLPAAVERIKAPAIHLMLDRADAWPRARVLCLLPSPGAEVERTGKLAAALAAASHSIGLEPDDKPFRAHVTLARKLPAAAIRGAPWPVALDQPLALHADGFALMSSTGAGDAPRYKVVHAWGPGRGNAPASS
jgi:2'-5' RNA ligase